MPASISRNEGAENQNHLAAWFKNCANEEEAYKLLAAIAHFQVVIAESIRTFGSHFQPGSSHQRVIAALDQVQPDRFRELSAWVLSHQFENRIVIREDLDELTYRLDRFQNVLVNEQIPYALAATYHYIGFLAELYEVIDVWLAGIWKVDDPRRLYFRLAAVQLRKIEKASAKAKASTIASRNEIEGERVRYRFDLGRRLGFDLTFRLTIALYVATYSDLPQDIRNAA